MNSPPADAIHVVGLRLWAHVGGLEQECELIPIRLEPRKCQAPIAGFDGTVSVCRQRCWP